MDDTIEVCSGCGKMPRVIDQITGSFICSRCGNRTTMQVNADNYEKVVSELDAKFHDMILKQKAAAVPHELDIEPRKAAKTAAKAVKKTAPKKAPAKKAAKKRK